MNIFNNIGTKMKNPVFEQIEYKPITIDENKGDNTHFKLMLNEQDKIGRCALDSTFFNRDSLSDRDHKTFDRIMTPGINRCHMPAESPVSKNEREAEDTYRHSFINCEIPEFKRRHLLQKFIDMMQEKEFRIQWDFGDRIYLERHTRNTLQQQIYKALLFDPHVIYQYNKDADQLLLITYFKNPPGRILRQQWKSEWKVLPNLEFWINKFKPNKKNMANQDFFNIDYQRIGDIHDRTKLLFPNDQSIIICQKYLTGIHWKRSFKVIKENLTFGIRQPDSGSVEYEPEGTIHDKKYAEVWVQYENGTQMLIEMQKNYVMREK